MSARPRRNAYDWWALVQYAKVIVPVAVFVVVFLAVWAVM